MPLHIISPKETELGDIRLLRHDASPSLPNRVDLMDELGNDLNPEEPNWCKNCGIYGKSTKFCAKIENYLLNNFSYGPK